MNMSETLYGRDYVDAAIASFENDPPDSDYQKGYLAALKVVRDEAFGDDVPIALSEYSPERRKEALAYASAMQGIDFDAQTAKAKAYLEFIYGDWILECKALRKKHDAEELAKQSA
jgi:hypothetical protein